MSMYLDIIEELQTVEGAIYAIVRTGCCCKACDIR